MSTEFEETLSTEEIRAYWTPERKAAARPKVWTLPTTPQPDAEPVQPTGEQKEFAGYNPTQSAEASEVGSALDMFSVPNPTAFPSSTVGKLYFVWNGQDWTGSACVVSRNTLLTAAHNIEDIPKGSSNFLLGKNFVFAPALLSDGTEPFNNWIASTAITIPQWTMKGKNPGYDVGILQLGAGGLHSQPIGDVVGVLSRKYNLPLTPGPKPAWITVGYPGVGDGDTMYADQGTYTRRVGNIICKSGSMNITGASGGPWLLNSQLKYVNGIHSGGVDDTNEICSPYFNDTVCNFIESRLR